MVDEKRYLTKKIFTDISLIDYRYVIQNKGNSASEGMHVCTAKCEMQTKAVHARTAVHIQKLTEDPVSNITAP